MKDGVEACEVFTRPDPPPMAILDWFMPNMNGLDVVRKLRAFARPIPTYIVMLTGREGNEGLVEALEAGADEYITKPFKAAELRARIKVGARVTGLQVALGSRVLELEGALAARKRVEEELRRNEERFRLLFSTIPEPVWGFDTETLQVLEVNEAALEHYGFSREEFLGMKVTDIWEDSAMELAFRQQEQSNPIGLVAREGRHRTKDGRILDVEVRWGKLNFADSRAALLSVHDITEKKHLELELRQSQKLEAVGTLAAGVAHEINTPIQFVGDNTHFLNESFGALLQVLAKYQNARGSFEPKLAAEIQTAEQAADLPYLIEEVPKALSQTLEGVNTVARIVRAMKEFAHPDGEGKTPSDINRAVQNVLVVARNEFKLVADIETHFAQLPLVICQIGEINQVLLNLLVNAAHAVSDTVQGTEHRGRITVRTRQEAENVVISIEDTGTGIPQAIRNRIFDPFFTTKEVGRGTGQGLAISRSVVVDKHFGTLTFQSELGRGTTFYVRLPINGIGPQMRKEEAITTG